MQDIIPVITIDGPSGVGKGTVCQAIAKLLRWHVLDSGAIYRVLAVAALHHKVNIQSEEKLVLIARQLDVNFSFCDSKMQIIFEGKNITDDIRLHEISNIASCIAVFPRVRDILLNQQRKFRKKPGLIADGRDVGTIVFPDACIKIFLDASVEKRAYRRMLQLQKKGFDVKFNLLLSEIKDRDYRDRNRFFAPLAPAKDALVLDSSNISSDEVIDKVLNYVNKKFITMQFLL